jgi:hypothetical protein
MINYNYHIDITKYCKEGGCCQFYYIKGEPLLGFKEFNSKKKAKEAYLIQKKLSKFDLSPKVYGDICKLNFCSDDEYNFTEPTNWGYLTEIVEVGDENTIPFKKLQNLVDEIYEKTGLKFWDCHWWNIGVAKRGKKKKLVCIDTGKETWDGFANAWGFAEPGPKCCYCYKYQCECLED